VAGVNRKLLETPLPFLVNIEAPPTPDAEFGALPMLGTRRVPGLLYRRPIPYTVDILEDRRQKEAICRKTKERRPPDGPDPDEAEQTRRLQAELVSRKGVIPSTKSQQVLMTAGGPVAMLEFGARPFVTTNLQATFKEGVLIDNSEVRPSEALGFSRIPLNAVRAVGNAVGAVVTQLVQLRIDTTAKSKEVVEAQTELAKAKEANAELQKEILDKFDAANKPAPEAP